MSTPGIQLARADGGTELFSAVAGESAIAVQTTLVAAATRLVSGLNRVVPIAGSTAVTLPMNQPVGVPITVANYAASAITLLVFPPWNTVTAAVAGGAIQGGSANASFSVAQSKTATFYPLPNGIDYVAVLSA